jgi:CheY-like chemotaxis protein
MRILLVEDDIIQSDFICDALEQEFPGGEVELIKTEQEFRSRLDNIAKRTPDVVIMDVMLRWTDPSPDQVPSPEDVREEGHYRAGFRCRKLLSERGQTKDVPVILYTVLDHADISHELQDISIGEVQYLRKESSAGPLLRSVRKFGGGKGGQRSG